MAFVRKKIKKGNPYFYIVESVRSGDKVRQRTLEYIGPLEKLMELALKGWEADHQDGDHVLSFKAYKHASCMAMYYMASLIGVEQILDSCLPPKTVQGLPRSRVLLLAMIHRAVDPGSKRAFAAWAAETSLPYHLDFDPKRLTSASFWEAMDGIDEEQLFQAQRQIVDRVVEMTGSDLKTFHLDYTNYFTFIDSKNTRCIIAKRGHNKQKRDDLRQFSLAVLTSYALQIPLVWQMYDGNKNDKAEFPDFTAFITKELKAHGINPTEVTVTLDGGSNSEENFSGLDFHIICSHSMTGMKELYDIDLDDYKEIRYDDTHSRLAYRLDDFTFSGITGTGILTYSQELMDGQMAQLEKELVSLKEAVTDLNDRLANRRSRIFTELAKRKKEIEYAAREASEYNAALKQETGKTGRRKKEKAIPVYDEICELKKIAEGTVYKGYKSLKEFTELEVAQNEDGRYRVTCRKDEERKQAYCRKYFGKKLTCTDHTDWSTEQILKEYGEQECIETNIFKVSKDIDHFSVRPQDHWTDDKIRAHTFICLSSMIIAEMLRIRMEDAGIRITKHAMLERLSEIHDGWVFKDEKKVIRTVEKLDDEHMALWQVVESIASEMK